MTRAVGWIVTYSTLRLHRYLKTKVTIFSLLSANMILNITAFQLLIFTLGDWLDSLK